jgi:hypothetical protein
MMKMSHAIGSKRGGECVEGVKHVFEGNVKISVALGTCKYDSGGCERIRIAASASSMRH